MGNLYEAIKDYIETWDRCNKWESQLVIVNYKNLMEYVKTVTTEIMIV